ncbi:thyroid transcription factor 1-like [Tachypleus tridentatus]|uniref:thyroid transcription factor 1-like n=1 Tax=Tachypleus tridentatus TaxID=6853 RepID=UPI003FD2FED2
MPLSPKLSTPFFVTDILNPFDESYKRTVIVTTIDANESPTPLVTTASIAYCNLHNEGNMNEPAINPYMVPQLAHPNSFASQYCNDAELSHYGDNVRQNAVGWYGPSLTHASQENHHINSIENKGMRIKLRNRTVENKI